MPGSPRSLSLRESEQTKHTACFTVRGLGGVGKVIIIHKTHCRYICKPNPTCKNMHLLFYMLSQSATNLSYTVKSEHPQGEMAPIHLIPRIISHLHSCWFSASVLVAGIEAWLGSALLYSSTVSTLLLFIHFLQRQGMVQVLQNTGLV